MVMNKESYQTFIEAVSRRCYVQKVFLEISQTSQ